MVGGGGVVVHGVDAGAVERVKAVRKRRGEVVPGLVEDGEREEDGEEGREEPGGRGAVGFDVIAFMFPHIGGKSTHLDRQVRDNQQLLQSFFAAAKPLLSPRGVIVVTLFEGKHYELWDIKGLARAVGFQTRTSFKFVPEDYPGYAHARTLGNISGGGRWKGEERDARTFIFEVGDRERDTGSGKQRKRKKRDGSPDED
jgi:25S rRNA (uracil2634-N3)-methyltransferase